MSELTKVCPDCGKLASYNYWFKRYVCEECRWWSEKIVK